MASLQTAYHQNISKTYGFTLVEVVLAMMIMASGLMILTNSWGSTYTRLKKTQVQVQMAALLERKVYEIEKEYKNKSLETIPEEKTDEFGSELPGYSWTMKSQKLELPDLSSMLGGQDDEQNDSGPGGQSMSLTTIIKMFTEHLNKSIKEVKVEIVYTGDKKPQYMDVVFYLIDYDRPLPLPGAGG